MTDRKRGIASVRMADLSVQTGVSLPTIKYYLREGLLSPGRPVGRNEAEYDAAHVRRLKLVRTLVEYGGLSIAVIRELIAHLDDPDVSGGDLLGVALLTVTAQDDPPPGPDRDAAERIVDDLLRRRGWKDLDQHPMRRTLIGLVTSLTELGREDMLEVFDDYSVAAERVAEADLRVVGDPADRERALEIVVLGDTVLTALRRLAQAHGAPRK
ncbi:MerR family transcriptional regulator [Nonomuraea basaltis]|uniref:MerR family transcriptional regulator n=1 Tax=Nonomuraea basaltis TaxID=2495887 RepID=UPI00110C6198|nr:MerR family transcriptional regulator [Nonomuraea basaltis]TMR95220.1 MerR family transcriptional regulator [Nonomuraea basaltis]